MAVDSPAFATYSMQWVASMTKLLTAICALQLVEDGTWGLDDDMCPLLPDLDALQILRGFDESGQPILEDKPKPGITLR